MHPLPNSDENGIMITKQTIIRSYSGIPTNMTSIAEKLNSVGYVSHAVGKWQVATGSLNTLGKNLIYT